MSGMDYSFVDPATSHDRSGWLSVAIAIFLALSLFTLLIRAWIRLSSHGPWGHDDSAILLSFIVAVGQVAATAYAEHVGYGQRFHTLDESEKSRIQKGLYAAQLLYIIAVLLGRLSTALLIVRLTRHRPHIKAAYGIGALCLVWAVVTLLVVAVRGDLSEPWATMDGSQIMYTRWIATESIGLVIEALLFGLSLFLVWGLQMAHGLRAMIIAAFACRLVMIPIVAIRLHYLKPSLNADPTFDTIISSVVTQAVMNYSTFAASIICIKPFIRAFSSGYVASTDGDERASRVQSLHERYRMKPRLPPLSSKHIDSSGTASSKSNRFSKDKALKSTIGEVEDDGVFDGEGQFTARADSRNEDDDDDRRYSKSPSPTQGVIRQTRIWEVQRDVVNRHDR